MFPTAVCTFRSGERIFRSGERTFRSGERTFRSAEYKTDTCIGKNITAIVNTLRQLLLHIHYHYPHTITMLILRYLISDRRCDRSDGRFADLPCEYHPAAAGILGINNQSNHSSI